MKKILLTLGSIASVVAPVAAVVACGSSTEYTQENQDILGKVSASEATRSIEADWLIKVLHTEYSKSTESDFTVDEMGSSVDFKSDFVKTARLYLSESLKNDPSFLSNIYSTILAYGNKKVVGDGTASNKGDAQDFDTQIFDKSLVDAKINGIGEAELLNVIYNKTVDDASSLISKDDYDKLDEDAKSTYELWTDGKQYALKSDVFNPIVLDLKNTILKQLVTQKYLNKTRKEWGGVFKAEETDLDDYIKDTTLSDTEMFPLIKEVMTRKMAIKWEAKLDETDSTQFIDFTKPSYKIPDLMKLLISDAATPDDKVVKHLEWSAKTNRLFQPLFKSPSQLFSTDINKIVGYAGISSLPSGEDGLLFTAKGIKAQSIDTVKTPRTGVYEEGKIIADINTDIKYIQKNQKTFDVTLFKSLMPEFDATKNELSFDGTDVDVDELKRLVSISDSSLYQDALKYFTTEVKDADNGAADKDAIKVYINNEGISKIWIDKGLSYVEYTTDETKVIK